MADERELRLNINIKAEGSGAVQRATKWLEEIGAAQEAFNTVLREYDNLSSQATSQTKELTQRLDKLEQQAEQTTQAAKGLGDALRMDEAKGDALDDLRSDLKKVENQAEETAEEIEQMLDRMNPMNQDFGLNSWSDTLGDAYDSKAAQEEYLRDLEQGLIQVEQHAEEAAHDIQAVTNPPKTTALEDYIKNLKRELEELNRLNFEALDSQIDGLKRELKDVGSIIFSSPDTGAILNDIKQYRQRIAELEKVRDEARRSDDPYQQIHESLEEIEHQAKETADALQTVNQTDWLKEYEDNLERVEQQAKETGDALERLDEIGEQDILNLSDEEQRLERINHEILEIANKMHDVAPGTSRFEAMTESFTEAVQQAEKLKHQMAEAEGHAQQLEQAIDSLDQQMGQIADEDIFRHLKPHNIADLIQEVELNMARLTEETDELNRELLQVESGSLAFQNINRQIAENKAELDYLINFFDELIITGKRATQELNETETAIRQMAGAQENLYQAMKGHDDTLSQRNLEQLRQSYEATEQSAYELQQQLRQMEKDEAAAAQAERELARATREAARAAEELYEFNVKGEASQKRTAKAADDAAQAHRRTAGAATEAKAKTAAYHMSLEGHNGTLAKSVIQARNVAASYTNMVRPFAQAIFYTESLGRSLGILETNQQQHVQTLRQTENQADQTKESMESLEAAIFTLNRSIQYLTENMEKTSNGADVLGHDLRTAGDRAHDMVQELFESTIKLENFQEQAQQTGGEIRQMDAYAEQFAETLRQVTTAVDRVSNELGSMNENNVQAQAAMRDTFKESQESLRKIQDDVRSVSNAITNSVIDMLQDASYEVYYFAQQSVEQFIEFDKRVREVFTLMPNATLQMRMEMTRDVKLLGTELGRVSEEMLPAIYNAVSAGIPPDNVLSEVAIASDAARAGVAELDATMKLGVGILNAKVTGVEDLTDVYDQLFFLVQKGVTTFPELTNVMSQVTSVAGEAGVSMQDITSAMIVMTRQGDSTAEAAELLSIMLVQLSTAGTTLANTFQEASGTSFREFISQGGTLAGAMQLLQQHAEDTGQALGNILGGGSPFFRDTQAARGALELTGKHLEELVEMTGQAHNAMGAMGQAAVEMGESHEMGLSRAKAALEEFKIAGGEYLLEVGEPLLENATRFFRLWSGNYESGIGALVDDVITETGGLEVVATRLSQQYDENLNYTGRLTGGLSVVRDEMLRVSAMAIPLNATNEEIEQIMTNLFDKEVTTDKFGNLYIDSQKMNANVNQLLEMVSEHANYQAMLAATSEETQFYDDKLTGLNNTTATTIDLMGDYANALPNTHNVYAGLDTVEERLAFNAAMSKESYEEAALAYELTDEYMAAYNERIQRTAELKEEEIQKTLAAAEAMTEMNNQYAYYTVGASWATEATTNWTLELFNNASTMDLAQDELILLAAATGEFTEAEIENMLRTAAMREAVDLLGEQIASGKVTIDEAVIALDNLEIQLSEDYTARLDSSEIANARDKASELVDKLGQVNGTFKASIKIETEGEIPTINLPSAGPTQDPTRPATALYGGGTFDAYEPILVGDGPGGQILPTSEMLMFNRPGTVINGQDTSRLLNSGNQVSVNIYLYGIQEPRIAEEAANQTIAALREIGIGVNA